MAIYSGFCPLKMLIFHSYVKLPEGNWLEGPPGVVCIWTTGRPADHVVSSHAVKDAPCIRSCILW